jgi:hypothetical protein
LVPVRPRWRPGIAFGVDETDIDRLGLRGALDAFLTAPADEPEAKEAPKPEDKAVRKPATKTRKEP